MTVGKITLLAGGMSLALIVSAFAQAGEPAKSDAAEQWNLETIPEGTGIVMANRGAKATRMKIGKKGHAALLATRSAIELPAKTMIYRKDGRLYIVPDRKMPEGNMLFDKTKGWDGD